MEQWYILVKNTEDDKLADANLTAPKEKVIEYVLNNFLHYFDFESDMNTVQRIAQTLELRNTVTIPKPTGHTSGGGSITIIKHN